MSIVLQGSTSGSITLQEPAVAGSTVLDLPAVSGTILTTTSPKAGNVIQVVNATYSTTVSTTSSSFVTTGLTASITPTSSSSKILIIVSIPTSNSASNENTKLTIYRNSTNIAPNTNLAAQQTSATIYGQIGLHLLDSPSTTSSTTYTVYGSASGGMTATFNSLLTGASSSVITLMEIAA